MDNFNSEKITLVLKALGGLSLEECNNVLSKASIILKDYFDKQQFTVSNNDILEIIEKEKYNPVARKL